MKFHRAITFTALLAICIAACVRADAVDESKPESVAKAFLVAAGKLDVEAAKKLLSSRLKEMMKTGDEVKKFLTEINSESGDLTVIGASEMDGTTAKVPMKYTDNGKERQTKIKMIKEGDVWKWNEN